MPSICIEKLTAVIVVRMDDAIAIKLTCANPEICCALIIAGLNPDSDLRGRKLIGDLQRQIASIKRRELYERVEVEVAF